MNLLIENCELAFHPEDADVVRCADDVGRYADDVRIYSWDKDDLL